MANKDANHSTSERTILWIIIPATIFVSLMFTRLNHKMEPPRQALHSDFSVPKKVEAPAHTPAMEEHATPADTSHTEAAHAPQETHEAHH